MAYIHSTRICSLFSNPAKSGGTYYSGKVSEDVTIPAGSRLVLVRSSKTAANGSEIWSLLVDEPGSDDRRRVLEQRSDVDLDRFRSEPMSANFERREEPPF